MIGHRRTWALTVAVASVMACADDSAPTAPPVITRVDVAAVPPLGRLGGTRQLLATARTATGVAVEGVAFTWASTDSSVVTVSADGLVTAMSNGSATVSASAAGVSGSTAISVQQVVASIAIAQEIDTILAAGQTRSFVATAYDSGNVVVPSVINWTSAQSGIATIDPLSGVATAVGPGSVELTASAGTVSRTATLVVRNGTLIGDRVLLTDFGNVIDNHYVVDDDFVVWWHASQDWSSEAQQILTWLKGVKTECLDLGLSPPPTVARGTYLNVYLHEPGPGNDNYPDGWGAGVGTDGNELPFLSVGSAQRNDEILFRHEGFHLCQYTDTRTAPGFAYTGDGSWYTEAVATWFSTLPFPTRADAQLGAATITANPQLALWHGWTNSPPGDPVNWNRTTRQYALSTWLDYLTTTGGAPVSVLVNGYTTGSTLLPQAYLASQVPGLHVLFADYAAASTPDMPYLTEPQWTAALNELATYGDAADRREFVLDFEDAGSGGEFVEPPTALRPRGWGWNVVRVRSTQAAAWRFELEGSPQGSAGAAAAFEARLIVQTAGSRTVHASSLANALDGAIEVDTADEETELFLVVVAVPQQFSGSQSYAYRVRIDRQ